MGIGSVKVTRGSLASRERGRWLKVVVQLTVGIGIVESKVGLIVSTRRGVQARDCSAVDTLNLGQLCELTC